MSGVIALVRKEFRTTLNSFSSYLVLAFFSLVTGIFFFANIVDFSIVSEQFLTHSQEAPPIPINFTQAVITPFFMNVCLVLILMVPILTMRSFSEEKKLGTFELLFTYPVSDVQIVAAKFLAMALYLLLLLMPTAVCFYLFYFLKGGVEMPVFLIAFSGMFLIALTLICLGLLISSLTDNQVVSAMCTFLILILFWMMGWVSNWISPDFSSWFKEMWIVEHMRAFARGILDSKHVMFYLIGISFCFFATVLSIESRSWKR